MIAGEQRLACGEELTLNIGSTSGKSWIYGQIYLCGNYTQNQAKDRCTKFPKSLKSPNTSIP